jgi:hypothetical protein
VVAVEEVIVEGVAVSVSIVEKGEGREGEVLYDMHSDLL